MSERSSSFAVAGSRCYSNVSLQASHVQLKTAGSFHQPHHDDAQMREEDDTILEAGIGRSGTPLLAPLCPPTSVPPMADINEDGINAGAISFSPAAGVEGSISSSVCSVGAMVLAYPCDQTSVPEAAYPLPPAPFQQYRRCLSGDDFAVTSYASDEVDRSGGKSLPESGGDEDFVHPSAGPALHYSRLEPSALRGSPSLDAAEGISVLGHRLNVPCQGKPVRALDSPSRIRNECAVPLPTAHTCHDNVDLAVDSDGCEPSQRSRTRRSKSFDRLVNEAVQFAEAVGEVSPTNESEIIGVVIQEDNSSDDDDDDDDDDEGTVIDAHETTDSLHCVDDYPKGAFSMARDEQHLSADQPSFEGSDEGGVNNNPCEQELVLATAPVPISSVRSFRRVSAEPVEGTEIIGKNSQSVRSVLSSHIKRPWLCKQLEWPPRSHSAAKNHLTLLQYTPEGSSFARDFNSSYSGLPQHGQQFEYRGIHANPPEITKRGISRGNYAQLHRKAWLEVSDKYHRYGKNLRMYYKHWESLGHPTNMFFDWLDSKGEAAGQPLPNLPECPRSELDSDTVLYITNPEVQASYALGIVPDDDECGMSCILIDSDGGPVRTGPEGWIFVLRDHVLYGAPKVTSVSGKSKQRFHHSSFFSGKAVAAAGILITDERGRLKRLYPHSGHYRPGEAHMQRMLFFLQQSGVDLSTFDVDLQQILHVSRTVKDANTPKGGAVEDADGIGKSVAKKPKKVDSLHLKSALYVACFLAHKARMIGYGAFSQIHKIRETGAISVSEALDGIDDGGYWKSCLTQDRTTE